jgi:putative restriction endonuclease
MSAFLLTWRDIHWPYTRIERMVQIFGRKGYVIEPWKILAHKQAKKGDRVWLLKQGEGEKFIFGAGNLLDAPTCRQFDREAAYGARIKFDAFVDPLKRSIIGEYDLTRILTRHQIAARASGQSALEEDQEAALEECLRCC